MKKYFILFIISAGLNACSKIDNVNPNVPSSVNPGVILPQVIYNTSNTLVGNAFELNNELIQYTCMNNTFTEVQRFKLLPANSNGIWGLYNRLRDLDDIIAMSESGSGLSNYKAIARVLKVYLFSVLTDTYGDIPYSNAGKGAAGEQDGMAGLAVPGREGRGSIADRRGEPRRDADGNERHIAEEY